MREGRCISLIERLKQGSELKSTLCSSLYGCGTTYVCLLYMDLGFN